MKINEDELEGFMEDVAERTGLDPGSIERKLVRFREGRRLYASTAEDWEHADFNFDTASEAEGDDKWIYRVADLWLTRFDRDTTYRRLVFQALKLEAIVEHLLAEARFAQNAKQAADEKEGVGSATTADGQPATPSSGMECYANDLPEDDLARVGYRIMLERKHRGWTEVELAEKASPLSASRIYAIESRGYSGFAKWEIEYIAEALGVTTEYLLTGNAQEATGDEEV